MELNLTLEDFEIQDLWTNNIKWKLLIEAKETQDIEYNKDSHGKKDQQKQKMALIIKYLTDSNFKECPYHLKMVFNLPILI